MTNLDAINKWLSNPADYDAGLKLYHETKINTKLDAFFAQGDGATQRNILRQKLSAIAGKLRANPRLVKSLGSVPDSIKPLVRKTPAINARRSADPSNRTPKPRIFDTPDNVDIKDLPPYLQEKWRNNKRLYKEQTRLHAEMQNAESDDLRADKRADLLKVQEALTEGWKLIDDYLQSPDSSTNDKSKGAKLEHRRDLLKEYIRRDQKKLDIVKKSKPREKITKRIANRQFELKEIEDALKSD